MTDLLTLERDIHQNAVDHGFWEGPENANIPTKLMLIVSELGEALEEFRADRMDLWREQFRDEDGVLHDHAKPEGFGIELADALIRILDLAAYLGLDMGALVELKMDYNAGRPHMHGGRRV